MHVTDTRWYGIQANPEANITSKKSRLKVYDNKNIYLKDGTNFEIELHNPTFTRYMAKIWINDKLISKSGIIIQPGQRSFIERFIDENAKFVFKTFEVDDVQETSEARGRNGLVKVKFYPEMPAYNTTITIAPPVLFTYTSHSNGDYLSYSKTSFSTTSLSNRSLLNEATLDSVETGRVSQGEASNQQFTNTTGCFSQVPYYNYEFHLLPESLKAIEAGDIRNYCDECGIRIKKSNWKFCPNCGEKI